LGWFDPRRKMYKTTRAGHVLDAYVSPTLEVMVTVDPIAMHKRFDPATDLTLIDPALQ
jgi:predicted DNA-binding protein with PD1-like motif